MPSSCQSGIPVHGICGISVEMLLSSPNSLHTPAGFLPPHPSIYVENCSLRNLCPAENSPFWVLAASSQSLLLLDSCLQCNFGEQKCYWPERETKLLFKATSAPKPNKQSVGQLPRYFSADFLGFFSLPNRHLSEQKTKPPFWNLLCS